MRRFTSDQVRAKIAAAPARLLLGHHCPEGCRCLDCATTASLAKDPAGCCGQPVGLDTPYQIVEGRPVHVACLAVEVAA